MRLKLKTKIALQTEIQSLGKIIQCKYTGKYSAVIVKLSV